MLKKFYPNDYVDSIYEIDFASYYKKGYRGLIFDIDNTLVPHGAPSTKEAVAIFNKIKGFGFKTCLISNNQEPRVTPFAKDVNSPYIYNAHKPSTKNYIKAMEIMETDKSNTIFIGDQVFTDIYGANRTGIYSILSKPINPKEEIQIVLKRYLESIVLFFYKRKTNENE